MRLPTSRARTTAEGPASRPLPRCLPSSISEGPYDHLTVDAPTSHKGRSGDEELVRPTDLHAHTLVIRHNARVVGQWAIFGIWDQFEDVASTQKISSKHFTKVLSGRSQQIHSAATAGGMTRPKSFKRAAASP